MVVAYFVVGEVRRGLFFKAAGALLGAISPVLINAEALNT
jgi:hypothetical protein